jgi:hypothetical protein
VRARDAKRGDDLVTSGLARARQLVDNDPINNEWKETLVRGLLARAASADAKTAASVLTEAEQIALPAHERAPQNVQTAALLGEVDVELAARATARGEAKTAAAAWQRALEVLEPLAKEARLPAPKLGVLARARAKH